MKSSSKVVKMPCDFKDLLEELHHQYSIYPLDYVSKFESIVTQSDVNVLNRYIGKICKWSLKRDFWGYDEKIKRDEILMSEYIKYRVERFLKSS